MHDAVKFNLHAAAALQTSCKGLCKGLFTITESANDIEESVWLYACSKGTCLYKRIIWPCLEYSCAVRSPHNIAYINALESVQHRAAH